MEEGQNSGKCVCVCVCWGGGGGGSGRLLRPPVGCRGVAHGGGQGMKLREAESFF